MHRQQLRRFFVDTLQSGELSPAVVHHLAVLRLPPGSHIRLFAPDGASSEAVLESATQVRLIGEITHTKWTSGLTVAVPLLKGDRQDWLIEKLCELGVDAIVPLVTDRAVIRELSSNKAERFARLITAACKQCGRDTLMQVQPVTALEHLTFAHALVLDPRAVSGIDQLPSPITLIIGPEGGLTDQEVDSMQKRGALKARIAPFILRAETAALAAASVAMAAL